jgi:hypothetical protein
MAEMLQPWMLPSPAAFVARACGTADRQKVAVLHAPYDARGLAEAVHDHLMADGRYAPVRIDLDAGCTFEHRVSQEFAILRSSGPLATSPELQNAAIVLLGRGPADSGLATFARLIRRQDPGEGPVLVVVSEDGGCRLDDQMIEPVREVFGPLDGAAYAAAMPRSPRPLESRLITSVAIEVAAWDVALLDRLTVLPPDQAARPDLYLAAWADPRMEAWRNRPVAWEAGSLEDWGGEPAEHALWLAANRRPALTKRVWRGQLAMLLPWIEQHRQAIIERERKALRPDPQRSGPDVESLDWGPLAVQLERVPELRRLLPAFREARNELAHGRPISWGQIRTCLDSARAYGASR